MISEIAAVGNRASSDHILYADDVKPIQFNKCLIVIIAKKVKHINTLIRILITSQYMYIYILVCNGQLINKCGKKYNFKKYVSVKRFCRKKNLFPYNH